MKNQHLFDVTVVYRVGNATRTAHTQYKTREEADIVARFHPIGAQEKMDDDGTVGVVHDVMVGETVIYENAKKPQTT